MGFRFMRVLFLTILLLLCSSPSFGVPSADEEVSMIPASQAQSDLSPESIVNQQLQPQPQDPESQEALADIAWNSPSRLEMLRRHFRQSQLNRKSLALCATGGLILGSLLGASISLINDDERKPDNTTTLLCSFVGGSIGSGTGAVTSLIHNVIRILNRISYKKEVSIQLPEGRLPERLVQADDSCYICKNEFIRKKENSDEIETQIIARPPCHPQHEMCLDCYKKVISMRPNAQNEDDAQCPICRRPLPRTGKVAVFQPKLASNPAENNP